MEYYWTNVNRAHGLAVVSKSGHAFIKQKMREDYAITAAKCPHITIFAR
jgi:hypothetical protein